MPEFPYASYPTGGGMDQSAFGRKTRSTRYLPRCLIFIDTHRSGLLGSTEVTNRTDKTNLLNRIAPCALLLAPRRYISGCIHHSAFDGRRSFFHLSTPRSLLHAPRFCPRFLHYVPCSKISCNYNIDSLIIRKPAIYHVVAQSNSL